MIDWLDELGKDWGEYMNKLPRTLSATSIEHKLMHEQGADRQKPGPTNPDWYQVADVLEFHSIWRGMPDELRRACEALYVYRGSPKARALRAGLSKTKMYELRSQAHYYVMGMLAQKDSGIISKSSNLG